MFLGLFLGFSNKSAQAASVAKRYRLSSYTMPKSYRGTWRHGKSKIKITKHTISGFRLYKETKKSAQMPYVKKTYLVKKHGKELVISIPQSDGFSLRRSGKYLIWCSMGTRVKYHK